MVPSLPEFHFPGMIAGGSQKQSWPLWLAIIAWILLILSASRPQWLGEPIQLPANGRDMMMAIDLSESMKAEDFVINREAVNRLTATKYVANQFITARKGDRIGLILFADQAYIQAPLTFDLKTIQKFLSEAFIGLAGKSTAIGDAIGLAIKRLTKTENKKILILITDGTNTAGNIEPIQAAKVAAEEGIKIYTIGVGSDSTRSIFGMRFKTGGDIDEKTLITIANITGGHYYRAQNTAELKQIYQQIEQLEPVEQDQQFFRPRTSLYFWPLLLASLLAMILVYSVHSGRIRQ